MTKQTKKLPSKKTIEKLRKLEAYILEEPKRFNLNLWGEIANPKKYKEIIAECSYPEDYDILQQKPSCGAVGCIAGDACILFGKIKPSKVIKELDWELGVYTFPDNTYRLAQEVLGLTENQALSLFLLKSWSWKFDDEGNDYVGWPNKFAKRLEKYKPGTKKYAQVAVDRIEHFIRTGE